jgi:predicted transcriptional regulator
LEVRLLKKDSEGLYTITPSGKILHGQVSSIKALHSNQDFFQRYDLSFLPEYLISLSALSLGEVRPGTMENVSFIEEALADAEEFVYGMTHQHSPFFIDKLLKLADKHVSVKIIYPKNSKIPAEFISHPKIEARIFDGEIRMMGGATEKIAAIIPPNDEGKIDFRSILASDDPKFIFWVKTIFHHYRENSRLARHL